MGYEGEPIGTTSDGTEVRQVTSSPPLRTGLPGPVRRLTPPPDQMVDASQGRQLPVSLHVL